MDKSNYVILIIVVLTLFTLYYFFNAQENFDKSECTSLLQLDTCLENTNCAWCYDNNSTNASCILLSQRYETQGCQLPRHYSNKR